MQVQMVDEQNVWRNRGRKPLEIPPEVRRLAEATYKTGKVGHINVAEGEEEEALELRGLLRSYALHSGRRMRFQPRDDLAETILFQMVDKRKYTKRSGS